MKRIKGTIKGAIKSEIKSSLPKSKGRTKSSLVSGITKPSPTYMATHVEGKFVVIDDATGKPLSARQQKKVMAWYLKQHLNPPPQRSPGRPSFA